MARTVGNMVRDEVPMNSEAAKVCQILTDAWQLLCSEHASLSLPQNVLLVPLTEMRGRPGRERLGHFAPSRWHAKPDGSHEVALHPGLFHEPSDLLLVLLHEAAHGLLLDVNGGCSSTGYYHRKEFRDQCLRLDLCCKWVDTRHGWNLTRWPEGGVPQRYKAVLAYLREQHSMAATERVCVPEQIGAALPAPGRLKLACSCHSERIIYVAKSVAERGSIRCELCQGVFSQR